jgi:hypothetical protein
VGFARALTLDKTMRQSEFNANAYLHARVNQGWLVGANFHKPAHVRDIRRSFLQRILSAIFGV